VSLALDRYMAVMKMPAPPSQPDPCALLLPELLAAIPPTALVALPEQGTEMLRFALAQEHVVSGLTATTFDLKWPMEPDCLPIGHEILVLVLPDPWSASDRPLDMWSAWTVDNARKLVQDLTTAAREHQYQSVLCPFIPGIVTLEAMIQALQVAYQVAMKDWGTCTTYLLQKEF